MRPPGPEGVLRLPRDEGRRPKSYVAVFTFLMHSPTHGGSSLQKALTLPPTLTTAEHSRDPNTEASSRGRQAIPQARGGSRGKPSPRTAPPRLGLGIASAEVLLLWFSPRTSCLLLPGSSAPGHLGASSSTSSIFLEPTPLSPYHWLLP